MYLLAAEDKAALHCFVLIRVCPNPGLVISLLSNRFKKNLVHSDHCRLPIYLYYDHLMTDLFELWPLDDWYICTLTTWWLMYLYFDHLMTDIFVLWPLDDWYIWTMTTWWQIYLHSDHRRLPIYLYYDHLMSNVFVLWPLDDWYICTMTPW